MSFQPTEEQEAIVAAFAPGDSDLVVEAFAGAAKTTTCRLVAESAPWRRGIYLAFGRTVADEASSTFPRSIMCDTAHAVARRAIASDHRLSPILERLNGRRVTAKETAEFLGIKRWFKTYGRAKDISSWKVASLATKTVERFCHSDRTELALEDVPWVLGVANMDELRALVLPYAQRVWDDVCSFQGVLAFQHDHYMKMWAMLDPRLLCDYVIVDEDQDTNPVLESVVRRQDHVQRVLVGDARQRLFDWRGSVDITKSFPNATKLWLSQSFRFGEEIADEANRWLGYMGETKKLHGSDWVDSELGYVESPRAILCRTNANVIDEAMSAQRAGRAVAIVGKGNVESIIAFAQAALALRAGERVSHSDLSIFKTWQDVLTYVNEEKPDGTFGTMVNLLERYGAQEVLAVASACVPESQADVVVSTVHKVKGLEWSSVRIADGILPESAMKEGFPSEQAMMIIYVALTRAQHRLDIGGLEDLHDHLGRKIAGGARRVSPSSV